MVFARVGLISFGGPAAHVALMRDEFVRRRGWLDDTTFIDLLGAANLIPGPTSTELAMHIGHRRAGRPGLIVAGLAFLLPAVAIVAVLAWIYVEHGRRPEIGALLVGIAPVVVAIVAHAGWSIGRNAIRTPFAAVLLVASVVAVLAGMPEIAVLLAAGVLALAVREPRARASAAVVLASSASATATAAAGLATVPAILITFLKVGAVLFGSGYVLVALLRSELVDGLGWLTESQLLDAIAVGQATPGPLFSTATFIGYIVGGPLGSAAATVGIFLPAFLAVAASIPVLDRLRRSVRARAFLDGVNVAAVALIAVVAGQLAMTAVHDAISLAAAGSALALLALGVGSGRLVLAGALLGLIRLAWIPH